MAESAAPTPPQGAIHDIGYRRYEGERLGRGALARALFVQTLRSAFGLGRSAKSKVVPFIVLGILMLPVLIWVAVTALFDLPELPVGYTEYPMALQPVLSIYLAVLAPTVLSRELRFRVTSLYFSRPLERMHYLLVKFFASVSALLVMIGLPVTVLFIGSLLAKLPWRDNLPDYLRAVLGLLLLTLLLAAISLTIAAYTPRRGMGIAVIVTVMVVLAGAQGVVSSVGAEVGNSDVELYGTLISPYTLSHQLAGALFDADTIFSMQPNGAGEVAVFAAVWLGIVAACAGLLALRYRRVSVL